VKMTERVVTDAMRTLNEKVPRGKRHDSNTYTFYWDLGYAASLVTEASGNGYGNMVLENWQDQEYDSGIDIWNGDGGAPL
jgi:hypothetical protein